MKIYSVKFSNNEKVYNFSSDIDELKISDNVIVETEKGNQFGKIVNIIPYDEKYNYKPIIRKASKKDFNIYMSNLKEAKDALHFTREKVKELNLDMNITDSVYSFDKSTLLLNFISDKRIDFRKLVKILASKYKTRIELHQLGVRDKAKLVGGIGPCGKELCCSKHLTSFNKLSINMAKNQNLALSPSRINGLCGRLKCCLNYEDDTYTDLKKDLPKVGQKIKHEGKTGKVIFVDVLSGTYKLKINNEIVEIKE